MKKILSIILSVVIVLTCLVPSTAFADNSPEDNVFYTQEEFELFEHTYATYSSTRATGLITDKNLGIGKNGTNLIISGYTQGKSVVKKCGFTKVVIQRKKSSSTSWSNYKTYEDLYSESNYYQLSKSVVVASGYQYRVTAIHYAKQSLFSTQKIEATTSYLQF